LGNLRLHYPTNAGTTSCVFHIGDATAYTPVTVAVTNVTSTLANSILTTRTDSGDHADTTAGTSGIDAAKSVNRNWTLTPGASLAFAAYDVTFTFLNGDIDGGATPANFIVGSKSGSEWTYPTVGAANPNDTSATGITQAGGFGAFAIGESKLVTSSILSEWRMDEYSWNGTANEVADSSGSNHGMAAGLSATKPSTANTSPAIAGDPGTCRYGVFDRANKDYVALPAGFPNLGTSNSFTVTAWIKTTDNTMTGQRIFIDDESTGGYGLSLGEGGTGVLRFYSRGTPSAIILDTGNVIANNTWYFVAAVADVPNKRKRVYVYNTAGTLLANVGATWTEASFGSDAGIASIGGETNAATGENTNAFGFAGNIEEVRVYQSALSASHVNLVRQLTHVCPAPPLDHISIEHANGQGLTCTPSTLTIKACMDAACSSLYTGGVTGTLTATGAPTVNWVGGTGFSIPNGGSSVSKDVQVTTAGSVVFGTQTGSVAPAPSVTSPTCNFGSPACTFTSTDAGLLFDVPHHVSEVLQNISVSAVKKADNSLACTPAFGSVSKSVTFTCAYTNPATGTLPVRVGGQALNAGNNAGAACDGTGQTVSLAFNASGVASTTVRYADVGNLTLNAQYTGSGADAGLVMTGADTFIAAPASFAFSAITAAPIKAGNNFSATITAKNNAGGTTPNFGKETTAEGVTLTRTKYQPTGIGSSNGSFSGSVGAFSGGAATASNLNWSEVGIIDLTATLSPSDYLNGGVADAAGSTGVAGAVGPFVPDHFDTVVTQGCPGSYSYSGQPFTVEVKAMNGAITPAVTVNYDGTFNTSPNFAKAVTLSDGNAAGVGTLAPTAVAASNFTAGIATMNTPAYTFTSRQTAQTTIKLRAVDADAGSAGFTEGTTDIRSGRAKLGNAHGSELLNLPLPFRTEYWNNGWIPHSADSCTGDVLLGAGNAVGVTLSALPVTCVQDSGNPGLSGSGCAAAGPVVQRFKEGATPGIGFAGNFNLWLKAPGAGNTGAVTVTGNVPPWLQYPWGGGAAINPNARATFGVYKGANEFIYQRENY
jgi:MSHA biogenesis protein MshQ